DVVRRVHPRVLDEFHEPAVKLHVLVENTAEVRVPLVEAPDRGRDVLLGEIAELPKVLGLHLETRAIALSPRLDHAGHQIPPEVLGHLWRLHGWPQDVEPALGPFDGLMR